MKRARSRSKSARNPEFLKPETIARLKRMYGKTMVDQWMKDYLEMKFGRGGKVRKNASDAIALAMNPFLTVVSNPHKKAGLKTPDAKAVSAYKKFHMSPPGEVRTVWIPSGWPKNLIVIGTVDRFDVQDASTGREISRRYSGDSVKVCMTSSRRELFILSTSGRKLGLKSGTAMRIDYTVPPTSGRNKWSPKWWHPHDSGPKVTVDKSGKAARVKGPKLKINVRGIIG